MQSVYKVLNGSVKGFKKGIVSNRQLFYDIETRLYNTDAENATQVKQHMYSFAVGLFDKQDVLQRIAFPNFVHFHNFIEKELKVSTYKGKKAIQLVAHNANGFDNHNVEHEMINYYNAKPFNAYQKQVVKNTVKMTKVKDAIAKSSNYIMEKRVRKKSSLEFTASINGYKYTTVDNLPKTGTSLRTLGDMLVKGGYISKEQTKTDLDYSKFDVPYDLTFEETLDEAVRIFNSLDADDFTYIDNDIIVLAYSVKHYSSLFYGFDWSKMTKTQSIKESYLINDLTTYQLLKTVGDSSIPYAVYSVDAKTNLFDFFNRFYKGGLNFYNDNYIGKVVDGLFSIDINSSYPYVMYSFKIPTFIRSFETFKTPQTITPQLDNDNYWYMYEMKKNDFNNVLALIPSKVARQMVRKYYFVSGDTVYLNTNTFKMIRDNFNTPISTINVMSITKWKCEYFGAREKIAEFYHIKTQGKMAKKGITVEFVNGSPTNIVVKDHNYKGQVFSEEQISGSKVNLNGLYGLPALRAFFAVGYRQADGNIVVEQNAFKNKERNVVFSAFVTSQAVFNLTEPLKYLTGEQIDNYFVYCDTDSLYLKKEAFDLIPDTLYDSMNLGKWDIEHENINKMYVLNHKKYVLQDDALIDTDKESEDYNPYGIGLRCGGVPSSNFNINMPIDDFILTQFHHGVNIPATRSIMNVNNTMTIYNAEMSLEQGSRYPQYYKASDDKEYQKAIEEIRERLAVENDNPFDNEEGLLYVETSLGTLTASDIYPYEFPVDRTNGMKYFISDSYEYENFLMKS